MLRPVSNPPIHVLALSAGVLALGVGACAGGEGDGGSEDLTVQIDTVAGVVHVRNGGAPPEWSLTEVLTLGAAGDAGGSAQQFGRISGVVAGADGRVYVADALAREIRVFREDGSFVRRIGQEGEGPGEFSTLQSIAWLGDRLAILDPGSGRLGLLSSEGEWLGQRRYSSLTGTDIRLHPTGPREVYMPMVRIQDGAVDVFFLRQTPEGPADTLPRPDVEQPEVVRVVCTHDSGRAISVHGASFAPRLLRVPAPGVLRADVWTADYRIDFATPRGDTVHVVERDLPPLPVTDDVWREEESRYQEFRERIGDAQCEPDRLPRPDAMEQVRTLIFDRNGRMWVEARSDAGWALDAFDAEGRLLATVPIPDRLERVPPYVRDDRLYLVVTDDLDVEYVKVFEIAPPTGSASSSP